MDRREDYIVERDGKFLVLSEAGKLLGEHDTREGAARQLAAVEANKNRPDGLSQRVDFLGEIHGDPSRTDGVLARRDPATGFLRLDAKLTRTGVFNYQDGDGNKWGELRTDAEVFAPESLHSFEGVVLTNDHPSRFVDADNVKDVQVGHVGTDVRRDGTFVRATIFVTDADTIQAIEDGKRELSCGYTAHVVTDRGTTDDGLAYQGRQTGIRGNHVAIVDRGRAGPSCRILDAAIQTRNGEPTMKTKKKDAMIEIGGVEFDIPDEVAAHIAALEVKANEAAADMAEGMEKEKPEVEVEVKTPDESAPRPDALQAKIDSLESQLAAARAGEASRIDARVSLVTTARSVLGAEAKTDGVDDAAIMRAVVLHVNPGMAPKLDAHAKSPGYLQAAYDHAVQAHADAAHHVDETNRVVFDAMNAHGQKLDLNDAYEQYVARQQGKGGN